jgi:hypothetical protein
MLPRCEEKTIVATFERAETRQNMGEYTHSMMKRMHRENRPLLEALCLILSGFKLDERSTCTSMTMMGLMYDALNTQAETNELNDLFGEGETDDA